jgi:hypothetical protein
VNNFFFSVSPATNPTVPLTPYFISLEPNFGSILSKRRVSPAKRLLDHALTEQATRPEALILTYLKPLSSCNAKYAPLTRPALAHHHTHQQQQRQKQRQKQRQQRRRRRCALCCCRAAMPFGRDASTVATHIQHTHALSLSNTAPHFRLERSFPHRRKMVEAAVFFIIGSFHMYLLLPRFLPVCILSLVLIRFL